MKDTPKEDKFMVFMSQDQKYEPATFAGAKKILRLYSHRWRFIQRSNILLRVKTQ